MLRLTNLSSTCRWLTLSSVVLLSPLACDNTASPACVENDNTCDAESGDAADGGTAGEATGDKDGNSTGGGSTSGENSGGAGSGGSATGNEDLDVGGSEGGSGGQETTGSGGEHSGPIVPGSEYCSATGWTVSEGYVDSGTICGHAWTYTHAPDASVDPPCDGGPCFTGSELCISGELPAADFASEILFGFNIAQEKNAGGPRYFGLGGSGVTVDFTRGGFTGEIRLMIDTGERYCATLISGKKLEWSDFSAECWEGGAMSPVFEAGTEIKAFLLQLNYTDQDQSFSDFCVSRITVHP